MSGLRVAGTGGQIGFRLQASGFGADLRPERVKADLKPKA